MKIHHLRNATFIIESTNHSILIDPMLGKAGSLPPFARRRHSPQRNPTVELPEKSTHLVKQVTHCLITHSHTFGLKALQHTDHLDGSGETFLKENNIPVTCREKDAAFLKKIGLNISSSLPYYEKNVLDIGTVTAIPAVHGHGWVKNLMANGAGYLLEMENEPSIYISGDTVLTKDVLQVLKERQPDIAVVAAGSASLDFGGPILMDLEEIVRFIKQAPGRVLANHMDALNHCGTSREKLRTVLTSEGLLEKTLIPEDGQSLEIV